MTQTHHISYDPEITIEIPREKHVKIHEHGTGLAIGEKPNKENRNRLVRFTVKFTKPIIEAIENNHKLLGYATPTEMIRSSVLEKIAKEAPWIMEEILAKKAPKSKEVVKEPKQGKKK